MEFAEHSFLEAPLTALSLETLRKLSNILNNLMIIHSANGYERDWRGLAALSEQSIKNDLQTNDPLKRVIELWCENNTNTANFGNLIKYLGLIDRWHVIEDLEENFQQDYLKYQQNSTKSKEILPSSPNSNNNKQLQQIALTTNDNTSLNSSSAVPIPQQFDSEIYDYESDTKVLTSSDVLLYQQGLPLQRYDAFLLYADKDYNYALEILSKLQYNPIYNFKFCLKDDLLFGIPFEHLALMELIRERCKFLIVILTKEFTKSPENRFFVNYAQTLQIKQEIRKVIPLMYEDQVEIPANLAMFSRMRYNPQRSDLYWSKVADSIQLLQFGEGFTKYSSTFSKSMVTPRGQNSNLAIEARNFHENMEELRSTSTSSAEHSKQLVRKRKSIDSNRPGKLKAGTSRSSKELQLERVSNGLNIAYSQRESKGILRKLFCCK